MIIEIEEVTGGLTFWRREGIKQFCPNGGGNSRCGTWCPFFNYKEDEKSVTIRLYAELHSWF